jgi:hypothetical protein
VGKAMVKIWSLPEASSIIVCQIESAGIPSGGSWPASCYIIRSASVALIFRFGTIDWVLGGGKSSEIEGGSSVTEGRLFETGGDEISEADEEESSVSRDYYSGGSCISLIVVIKEETSSSAGRDYIRLREMVMS